MPIFEDTKEEEISQIFKIEKSLHVKSAQNAP